MHNYNGRLYSRFIYMSIIPSLLYFSLMNSFFLPILIFSYTLFWYIEVYTSFFCAHTHAYIYTFTSSECKKTLNTNLLSHIQNVKIVNNIINSIFFPFEVFWRWYSETENAGFLYKLPQLCSNLEKWSPKHATILYSWGQRSRTGKF